MLILARGKDQTILIGDDVKVTVVGITGSQVRFGIEAPSDLTILRQELTDKALSPASKPDQES